MAYRSAVVNQYSLTRAAFLPTLWSELTAMGWTLFDTGGGTTPLATISVPYTSVNVNPTNTISYNSHGYVNGNQILYIAGTTVISGLSTNTLYFVVGVTANTFQLSNSQGGGALTLSSQGTGTHTFCEGYRVYSSNGEAGDRITEYIYINILTANKIRAVAYYLWNATTHVGSGQGGTGGNADITTSDTGFYTWIYGNKNIVSLISKVSSSYYTSGFGHLPQRFWTTLTSLTSAATAGSNVVINVGNSANFIVGKTYQIVGAAGEGRDNVIVNAKPSGTQLTITSLLRNYGIGSYIGQTPSTFGDFPNSPTYMNPTCIYGTVGLTAAGGYALSSVPLNINYTNPDNRAENRYVLQPIILSEASGAADVLGYIDINLLMTGSTGKTTEDTVGVGFQDSGTSTGSNTSNTLNDTSKTWTSNAWSTKVVIITAGTGAGQIRNIASNTGTQVTLSGTWTTVPDVSSQYTIYDEGYRYFGISSNIVYKEAL